eukprot:6186020-Pleurochrysis_carterae.AAC.2
MAPDGLHAATRTDSPQIPAVCAQPDRFCELWKPYYHSNAYWDDALHAPPGLAKQLSIRPWRNIPVTAPSKHELAASSMMPPRERCKQLNLSVAAPGSAEARPTLRPLHWLHFPKCGTGFGTTVIHYGCPRIPKDAAADDGAPIVSLTSTKECDNQEKASGRASLTAKSKLWTSTKAQAWPERRLQPFYAALHDAPSFHPLSVTPHCTLEAF